MGTPEDQAESTGELSDFDDELADVATETFEREKEFALRGNMRETLEKVEAALRKIERGTYGQCDICGQEISPARLEAAPYATLCVKCQAAVE
jgi:RNA polymerase-binding protein DksA